MTPTLLITGASTGIGAATARAAAEAGWQVALLARSQDELDSLAGEIGERALALPCDVTDRAALNAAVDRAVDHFGGLDAVVFTAGIGENSAEIRRRICEKAGWLGLELDQATNDMAKGETVISRSGSKVAIAVIPTNEEGVIARQSWRVLSDRKPAA